MIIETHAYPRAALIGNPSDGYYGKTIAFTFRNFSADVALFESPELVIEPNERDATVFASVEKLVEDIRQYGYYGGIRLLKATIKCFHQHYRERGLALHGGNFSMRYRSNIPNLVGLAGSSAIITAAMRALLRFYGVAIPAPELANLVRAVENHELSISAGLQDRVAQVMQGLIYMDFDKEIFDRQGYGHYEQLDPRQLPPLYIAYRTDLSEGSEVFHNDIRARFDRGDPEVREAMRFWAGLTVEARACLERGDRRRLGELMNANFDRRARLYRLSEGNLRLVAAARSAGACAKFTGSGGAIIGICEDDATFARLRQALEPLGVVVFRPEIV